MGGLGGRTYVGNQAKSVVLRSIAAAATTPGFQGCQNGYRGAKPRADGRTIATTIILIRAHDTAHQDSTVLERQGDREGHTFGVT